MSCYHGFIGLTETRLNQCCCSSYISLFLFQMNSFLFQSIYYFHLLYMYIYVSNIKAKCPQAKDVYCIYKKDYITWDVINNESLRPL